MLSDAASALRAMAEAGRGAAASGCRVCFDPEESEVAPISAINGLGREPTTLLVPSRSAPMTEPPTSTLLTSFLAAVETGDATGPAPGPAPALGLRASASL